MPAVVSGVFKQDTLSILGPLLRTYAIFHTALVSSVVLFRLSPFHSLARYPGPILVKISKLYFVSVYGVCGVKVPWVNAVFLPGTRKLARKTTRLLQEPSQEEW